MVNSAIRKLKKLKTDNVGPDETSYPDFSGLENEDVATAAAIRHIEMDGEPAELGKAIPIDTMMMYGMDMDKQGN